MSKLIVEVIENMNVDIVYKYEVEVMEENLETLKYDIQNMDEESDISTFLNQYKSELKSKELGKIWESYPEEIEIKVIETKNNKGQEMNKFKEKDSQYFGWTNRETWNVMLWINGTENLYFGVVDILRNITYTPTYREVIYILNLEDSQTGDGVCYLDSQLNYEELNQAISEMGEK